MPKFDGTGPNGKGPMTGLGSGSCIIPFGGSDQELGYLKNQEQALLTQLTQIKYRIKNIERKSEHNQLYG